MGCHFLLQGILPTQELDPCLLHCRQILYHWTPREVPRAVRFEGTNASLQDRNTEYSKSLKISLAYSIRSVGDSKVHLKDGSHWVEGFLLSLGIIQYKLGDFQVQKEKRRSYSYIECSL